MIRTANDIPSPSELLRYATWIRRLARALVSDETLAADVAQDVWVSALRRPPDRRAPLEPWFRRVMRHQVINRSRENKRREARDRSWSAPEGSASPEELLGRVQLQKRLVDAVIALEEPYRHTVLLRYFDGLSSAEIAERLGVPAATVRGRLKTAVARLRSGLDAGYQSRDTWIDELAGLVGPEADAPGGGGGGGGGRGGEPVESSSSTTGGRPRAAGSVRPALKAVSALVVVATISAAGWVVSRERRDRRREANATLALVDEEESRAPQVGERAGALSPRDVAEPASTPNRHMPTAPGGPPATPSPQAWARRASTRIAGTVRAQAGSPSLGAGGASAGSGGRPLANVVVRIVSGLHPGYYPVPTKPVSLQLTATGFVPGVEVAGHGQMVVITNLDAVDSKVSWEDGGDRVLERIIAHGRSAIAGLIVGSNVIRFHRVGDPRTEATTFVVPTDNPFFAVTAEDGRFVVEGMPPGRYTVMAWHGQLGTLSSEVEVKRGAANDLSFSFEDAMARFGPDSCRIALGGRTPVANACRSGGRSEAKRMMKKMVTDANAKGSKFTCEGCHRDLDGYALLKGAEEGFVKLTAAVRASHEGAVRARRE